MISREQSDNQKAPSYLHMKSFFNLHSPQQFRISGHLSMIVASLRHARSPPALFRWASTAAGGSNHAGATKVMSRIDSTKQKNKRKRPDTRKILEELQGKVILKDLETIKKESSQRYHQTVRIPSLKYTKKTSTILQRKGIEVKEPLDTFLRELFVLDSHKMVITDLFKPLDVGDAVELNSSLNQSGLAVVVEVPKSADDPRYTFMNKLGELTYLEKGAVKFRIPRLIPKDWIKHTILRIKNPDAKYGSIKTTADGFERYTVNAFARKVIVSPLVSITNEAWDQINETAKKLELIHRVIQSDGPREISAFSLLKAVNAINMKEMKEHFAQYENRNDAFKVLSKQLVEKLGPEFIFRYGEPTLGKEFDSLDPREQFDIPSFYALILALRKQNRLWASSYSSRSTLVPLSVTVLPLPFVSKVECASQALQNDEKLASIFYKYLKEKDFSSIPKELEPIMFLLKQYAVGNITDARSTTLVCQLMKVHSDSDILKSTVYNLLVRVGFVADHLTNPLHYSTRVCLPFTGVSNKATLEQEYIDLIDPSLERSSDLANKRVNHEDTRVYCIDNPDAHEIDDGVSISKLNEDEYRLYIHIADPTSYMQKNSYLTKIAYERTTTIYQPEVVSPMLPKSMSVLAGLGDDGNKTRALTFSIQFNIKSGTLDLSSANVEASIVSKFPKYTYADVNEVLDGKREKTPDVAEEHQELEDLFKVAQKLRELRIRDGAVVFGESINRQVKVSQMDDDLLASEGAAKVVFDTQVETKSSILVSELMILGNRIAANFLNQNKIPGVYRAMEKLTLSKSADTMIDKMNRDLIQHAKVPSVSDMVKSFKFITPSYYTASYQPHLMLGVEGYAPSSSPLRRFGDLVNHFNIHYFLNGEEFVFSESEVFSISLHMEARGDVIKKASRMSSAYYIIEKLAQTTAELGNFIVSTKPYNGIVFGILQDHSVMARMKLLEHKRPPGIGDVLSVFECVELDSVGGVVYLREKE